MTDCRVRLAPSALELRRAGPSNEVTQFSPRWSPRPMLPPEAVFNAWAGRMARTAREESARGVFLFALSAEGVFAGQVWLRADQQLRTASIGRHSACTLFLPDEDGLSLRQLLFTVQGSGLGPRCRLLDLHSGAGFFSASGESLSSVVFAGTAVFALPGYWLVCVPTGQPVLWDENAPDPWKALPRQEVISSCSRRAAEARLASARRSAETVVTSLPPLAQLAEAPLVGRKEEGVGRLVLERSDAVCLTFQLGGSALDRGVLLGRYDRCLGTVGETPMDVSRVHAVVFREEAQVFFADVGSTNGSWLGEGRVQSAPMEPGQRFRLGDSLEVRWEAAQ